MAHHPSKYLPVRVRVLNRTRIIGAKRMPRSNCSVAYSPIRLAMSPTSSIGQYLRKASLNLSPYGRSRSRHTPCAASTAHGVCLLRHRLKFPEERWRRLAIRQNFPDRHPIDRHRRMDRHLAPRIGGRQCVSNPNYSVERSRSGRVDRVFANEYRPSRISHSNGVRGARFIRVARTSKIRAWSRTKSLKSMPYCLRKDARSPGSGLRQ